MLLPLLGVGASYLWKEKRRGIYRWEEEDAPWFLASLFLPFLLAAKIAVQWLSSSIRIILFWLPFCGNATLVVSLCPAVEEVARGKRKHSLVLGAFSVSNCRLF